MPCYGAKLQEILKKLSYCLELYFYKLKDPSNAVMYSIVLHNVSMNHTKMHSKIHIGWMDQSLTEYAGSEITW